MSNYLLRYYYVSPINADRTRVIKKTIKANSISDALDKSFSKENQPNVKMNFLNSTATKIHG